MKMKSHHDIIQKTLLSFPLFVEYDLKPSIQNVIELKRTNPQNLRNPILTFVIPRYMRYVVERFKLEVFEAWRLLDEELKRQGLPSLDNKHKDYLHLKKIRDKLVAHRIENRCKAERHQTWYRSTYGDYESVFTLIKRVAIRIVNKINRLEFAGKLHAKDPSSHVVRTITQRDIKALIEALKKNAIY